MLSDKIVQKILSDKPLLPIHTSEEVDTVYIKKLSTVFEKLPVKLKKYLKYIRLQIIFIKKEKIQDLVEGNLYGLSVNNKIYLAIDREKSYKEVLHNFFHELGHLAFIYLIISATKDNEVKKIIDKFVEVSKIVGGTSLLAEKYMKEEYAKKLREQNKHIMHGIDIKFHENFAELFRLYLESLYEEVKWPKKELQELFLNEILCYYCERGNRENPHSNS